MNAEQEREEIPGGDADPAEKLTVEKPLEVDLSEDADDEGESAAAESPKDRKGRRAAYRELKQTVEREREGRIAVERRLAELQGRLDGMQRQAPPAARAEEESDPVETEMDGIEAQQEALLAQMRVEGISEEKFEKLKKQYKSLGRKLIGLAATRVTRGQEPQFDRTAYENQQLQAEFPDVFGSEVRLQEAKTELLKLKAAGKPVNIVTAREAARIVSQRYNRPKSPPSAADQARHTSVPSRPGGATGTSGKWAPTKLQLNAARAFTSHLEDISDEQRLKIWAQKVGKKNGLI